MTVGIRHRLARRFAEVTGLIRQENRDFAGFCALTPGANEARAPVLAPGGIVALMVIKDSQTSAL